MSLFRDLPTLFLAVTAIAVVPVFAAESQDRAPLGYIPSNVLTTVSVREYHRLSYLAFSERYFSIRCSHCRFPACSDRQVPREMAPSNDHWLFRYEVLPRPAEIFSVEGLISPQRTQSAWQRDTSWSLSRRIRLHLSQSTC